VVKHVDAIELRGASLPPQYSPPLACSSHATSQKRVLIWLPHWRLHMRYLARRNSLEAGSTREKKGEGGRRNERISRTGE
jgi:hypothetical protein